jgi:hypothetical protein
MGVSSLGRMAGWFEHGWEFDEQGWVEPRLRVRRM